MKILIWTDKFDVKNNLDSRGVLNI